MHKIYQDKGQFDFIYQLPQIIYSTLISFIIDILVKYFALTQNEIIELKNIKNINNLKVKRRKILCIIKIKLSLFFVISLFFLAFKLYYITCFCGIYINTQSHLFKDSIFSLMMSFLISILFNLLPGALRFFALRTGNSNRECFYKLSLFLS